MNLRRVEIRHFRGIEELLWDVGGDFVCLIGPGDSTKTTILDAIQYAFSPRWNLPFDDSDFYGAAPDKPIVITVTVSELPDELMSDTKYGYWARGWSSDGDLHDEPQANDELALSIRLTVAEDHEPAWAVINDRNPEGKPISARDRQRLGCTRLGSYLDRHFAWGRGSILSQLTADGGDISAILAAAGRAAREAVERDGLQEVTALKEASERARDAGAQVGVAVRDQYQPNLDTLSVSIGAGSVALYDGQVPLRRAGLGTRRLLAIGMQRECARCGGLALIDEVELGLEPYRIRHLLRVLRSQSGDAGTNHVIMTTHAPTVLGELLAQQLRVVRSENGKTSVLRVPDDLQPVLRRVSEAFLARAVIVCEGKTELGLCRGLDRFWWSLSGRSFALAGIALADGGGTTTGRTAAAFADLGYRVAVVADGDRDLQPSVKELVALGVEVCIWPDSCCLEERLVRDLPWEGVVQVVRFAVDEYGAQSVIDTVANASSGGSLTEDPTQWDDTADLRRAIEEVAKRKGWFKRVDLAEKLSEVVVRHIDEIREKPLGQTIEALRKWSHE